MISGRILSVNGETLKEPNQGENQQATTERKPEQNSERQGFGRELNLTWLATLPANNTIVTGQWFTEQSRAEVSVEERSAERMKLQLGDQLSLSIGGQMINAKVSSFRKVDWNSLQPNFFVILSPDLMRNFPATYMTAVHIPEQRAEVLNQIAKQFPTVSVISVATINNRRKI